MSVEFCSDCEYESEMVDEFIPQPCENCGVILLPCRICTDLQDAHKELFGYNVISCSNCPFDYKNQENKMFTLVTVIYISGSILTLEFGFDTLSRCEEAKKESEVYYGLRQVDKFTTECKKPLMISKVSK